MRPNRFAQIALALEERVRKNPSDHLPSIASLAEEFHSSYQTMWKAAQVLARKGVIVVRMGARMVPASGAQPAGARDRFLDSVRAGIREGIWKTGEPVPKFAYFQSVYHVGQDTIARIMRRLADEDLLHKQGRRWIVGSAPGIKGPGVMTPSGGSRSKVVLMLFPNLMDANNFFQPAPFISQFADELMKQGIKIEVVLHDKQEIEATDAISGINAIEARIAGLGDRYCGLFAHNPGTSPEYFQRCLAMALSKKKPVLLYDPQNSLKTFTRSLFGGRSPFFRLFADEIAATALAVDVLVNYGHRIIGFPDMFTPRHRWVPRRIEYVRKAAARHSPPPMIFSPEQSEPFWTYVQDKPISVLNYLFRGISKALRLRTELTHGIRAKPSIRQKLLEKTPSLASIFDDGATAIIAGNDYIARDYYYWLKIIGIDLPRHISMISFDNQPEFIASSLSTIDFGLGRLGYKAAHLLIGDIPAQSDAEGHIAGVCTLVDRGSIGKPRKGAIQM
jgi:hypothetical protein